MLAYFVLCLHTLGWSQTSCLNFDGVDDYIEATNTVLNNIGYNNFTLEAWIKGNVSGQQAHPMVLSNRSSGNTGMLLFFHGPWGGSSYKMLCLQLNGGANHLLINNGSYNGSLLDGFCHHVAIARDNDSLYYYADGSLIGIVKIFSSNPTVASSSPLWIGRDLTTNNTFNGVISQVRIWNITRTASEISGDMNASLPGSTPGLAAYWEMNDGTGQVVLDKTTNSNGLLGSSGTVDSNDPQWTTNCCALKTEIAIPEPDGDDLLLYPNPNNGILVVELVNADLVTSETTIAIHDLSGKMIFKGDMASDKVSIDISKHPAGVYLIQVIHNGKALIERFIKY